MHKIGICHRDLKPENMLLDYHKDLKIIDFGLSNLYKKNEKLKTACGSPGYAAPEMIKGEEYSGLLSDIWSIGIILYVMINGYLPFDDPNESVLYEKILSGKYSIPKTVSPLAKDLIKKILINDPCKRITIKDIRNHQWYNMCSLPKIEGLFISIQPIPLDMMIIETMKQYGYDKDEVIKLLLNNRHNNVTTLYYLIIKKNMKKGIGSISDMISKQFMGYIAKNSTKNQNPQYLVLTKTDSTILTQTQRANYKTHITKENENNNNNTINYDVCHTALNLNNINTSNQHYTINELNEYCNKKSKSKGALNDKIKKFKKLVRKMPFRVRKNNEHSMTNQLRTQYDSYIKKAWMQKRTGFNKGFLQTSTSFHKGEKNKNNHTFTIDDKEDNINLLGSNSHGSGSNGNNNALSSRKKYKDIFINGKKKKFFSLPKQKNKYIISTTQPNNNNLLILYTNRNRGASASKEKKKIKGHLNHFSSLEKNPSNNSNNSNNLNQIFKKFKGGSIDFTTNKKGVRNKNKSETYRNIHSSTTPNNTARNKNNSQQHNQHNNIACVCPKFKTINPFSKLKPPNRKNLQMFLIPQIKTSRGDSTRSRNANVICTNYINTNKSYL